jgi:hypothetical protein
LHPDGLLIFFLTFFQEKIKIFLKKIQNFPNLEKFWIEIPKRHLLPNFEPSSIFRKFSKLVPIFLTPEFLKEFQNSEYKVHQVGSNEAGSQNISFLAINTAELAPQISSKNRWQRRVTDGIFFALIPFFRYKK